MFTVILGSWSEMFSSWMTDTALASTFWAPANKPCVNTAHGLCCSLHGWSSLLATRLTSCMWETTISRQGKNGFYRKVYPTLLCVW